MENISLNRVYEEILSLKEENKVLSKKVDNFIGTFEYTENELKKIREDEKLGVCNREETKEFEKIINST